MRIEIKKRKHPTVDELDYFIMKRESDNKEDRDFHNCYDNTYFETFKFLDVLYLQRDYYWYANCGKENFFEETEAITFVFEYIRRTGIELVEIMVNDKLVCCSSSEFIKENEMII